MLALTVQITRYVDDHFPGFVECTFQDTEGKIHVFVEKVSVVSREALDVTSVYPAIGAMHCENELAWMDEAGRRLVRINTDHPWHIESMAGESRFVVLASQFAD
jgi:hypothetical protein